MGSHLNGEYGIKMTVNDVEMQKRHCLSMLCFKQNTLTFFLSFSGKNLFLIFLTLNIIKNREK